jgi:hypothetical protein
MYTLRIWVREGYHYTFGEELRFPTHDAAWAECCRLLNMGTMSDIVKTY